MAGPVCGLMLADLGADVIKVEKVPGGDDSRQFLPPDVGGESAAFMMMNRNKRGIAVDLKSGRGPGRGPASAGPRRRGRRELPPRHHGAPRARLRGASRRPTRASSTARSRASAAAGPYADRAGFDLIAQGMSGLMSITGEGPERPPVKVGAPVTDITAGILGALACRSGLCGAAQERARPAGRHLALRGGHRPHLLAVGHCLRDGRLARAHGLGPPPERALPGLPRPPTAGSTSAPPTRPTGCGFVEVIEASELARRPALCRQRRAPVPTCEILADAAGALLWRMRTTADWLARLEAAGVPAGPVLSIGEMHRDPQTRARDMVVQRAP